MTPTKIANDFLVVFIGSRFQEGFEGECQCDGIEPDKRGDFETQRIAGSLMSRCDQDHLPLFFTRTKWTE